MSRTAAHASVTRAGICVTVTLAAVVCAPQRAAAQCPGEPIGYIESAAGEWLRLPDEKPAVRDSCVFEGDSLEKVKDPSSGGIVVVLYSGQPFQIECAKTPCRGALRIPDPAPGRARGMWALLQGLWKSGPAVPPVFAAARGGGADLMPTVALYEAGQLNLATTVASLAAGTATFRLRRQLPSPDTGVTFTMMVPAGIATLQSLSPGVYSLEQIDGDGTAVGAAAAVFVPEPSDTTARALFDDAVAEVRGWQNANARTIRSFLTQAVMALHARRAP